MSSLLYWLVRGGNYNTTADNAGVFNFNNNNITGGSNNNDSFRLVMGDYVIRRV